MTAHASSPRRTALTWAALLILAPLFVALAVASFTWSNARVEPRHLPIGVVGDSRAAAPVTARLAAEPGAFEVHLYRSEEAARDAIEERTIYGAVLADGDTPTVLTATAASPAVASMLPQAVGADPTRVRVVDVAPTAAGDPRGSLLGASVFPLMLAGLATGVFAYVLTSSPRTRLLGVLASSAVSGVVVVALVKGWLDGLDGAWVANAGVLALITFTIAIVVTGFSTLIGRAGIGVIGLLFMLLGNPASGMTTAPELLPQWFAALGQLLPLGAGGALLRNVAYFDGNAIGGHLAVLIVWIAAGLLMLVAPTLTRLARRAKAPAETTSSTLSPA